MVENEKIIESIAPTLKAIHIYSRLSQRNTKTVKEYASAHAELQSERKKASVQHVYKK